jgi:hypothetical protein
MAPEADQPKIPPEAPFDLVLNLCGAQAEKSKVSLLDNGSHSSVRVSTLSAFRDHSESGLCRSEFRIEVGE